jgi:hypothetical protein
MMTTTTTKSMGGGCVCGPVANAPVVLTDPPAIKSVRQFKQPVSILIEDSHGGTDIYNEYNFGSAQLGRILTAQGAKVASTRNAPDFDSATGLTRKVLDHYNIVIFNGRFSGRAKPFTESEIAAVTDWVRAGGGLMVTCGAPTAGDHMDAFYLNPLIAPFRLQFAARGIRDTFMPVTPSDTHPIVRGLDGFAVYHGTNVAGQSESQDVLLSGNDSVMMTQKFGKGRVIVFGAGSALQNQALNSRIIHHAPERTMHANTKLAMNLGLWLAGVDEVAATH